MFIVLGSMMESGSCSACSPWDVLRVEVDASGRGELFAQTLWGATFAGKLPGKLYGDTSGGILVGVFHYNLDAEHAASGKRDVVGVAASGGESAMGKV